MNEKDTFVQADRALLSVVERIPDDRWSEPLPDDFPTADDTTYTLREILAYQAYDEAWIPAMVAGRTTDEVGEDTFGGPFEDALLGDRPKERLAELVEAATSAVTALDDADLDRRTVHYSYGDYPAREALWHASLFRAMRAVDVARVIGVDDGLPDDVVRAVWDFTEPNAEEWRAMGVFGPAVEVSAEAPLRERLLGLTGRRP